MIYLIAGRPRSGKSYEAVKYHVIPAIKSGRKVITNLPLNVDHFVKVFGSQARDLIKVVEFDYSNFDAKASAFPFSKPEDYQDDWRDENGVGPLYVIDEAHFSLPRGGTPPEVKKFFTMHGHYGVDILLMTQHIRQIDADVLNLVEIVYRTIKNTALGSKNTYTKKVQDGYRGATVNTEQRKYDKSIFPFYKSHTQSKKAVLEREASDIKPIWRHWSVYGVGVCLALLVYQLLTVDSINPMRVKALEEASSAVESPPALPEVTNKPSAPAVPAVALPKREVMHPYSRFTLHISGWADLPRRDAQGQLYQDYQMYFQMQKGSQRVGELTLRDLFLAGYEVSILGPCLVILTYETWSGDVTCDIPFLQRGLTAGEVLTAGRTN